VAIEEGGIMSEQEIGTFWTCGQERMIFFNYDSIKGCCANLKTGASPHMGNYGPGGSIDLEQLVQAKRDHLAAVRRGETPPACVDCPSWQQNEWPETPYLFADVNLGHFTACNTDCYYCRSNSNSAREAVAARNAPRLLPVLKEMIEREYIDPNAIIRFGGGEPTIIPEFEDLVNYFIDVNRRFWMNSSGVKYSPAIERLLQIGRPDNRVVISIDSASVETYKIIKGLDVGMRVWDNIARYAKIGPDILEVKYILLPENHHETGDFVRRCKELGVRRISFDLDCNPFLAGISGSLTDDIVEGIAIMIHEAKKRSMSVYWAAGGSAIWQHENGHARVENALNRLSDGRFAMDIFESGFVILKKLPQALDNGLPLDWGRSDAVMVTPLNFEPGAIYLQEGNDATVHRLEQSNIPVSAGEACTVEVIARPAGRTRLMIELRDAQSGAYTRAKYDLERKRVFDALDEGAAAGTYDDDWVRCQLTLTPTSSSAVLAMTLLDEAGCHIYQGTGDAGIYIRPVALYASRATQNA
jgi:pyruvate-formate lyase-activating enzyme